MCFVLTHDQGLFQLFLTSWELTPISTLKGVSSEGRKLKNGLVDRPGEHIPSGDCWIKAVLIPFNIFDKGKQRNSDFRTLPRALRYDIASFWIHILRMFHRLKVHLKSINSKDCLTRSNEILFGIYVLIVFWVIT